MNKQKLFFLAFLVSSSSVSLGMENDSNKPYSYSYGPDSDVLKSANNWGRSFGKQQNETTESLLEDQNNDENKGQKKPSDPGQQELEHEKLKHDSEKCSKGSTFFGYEYRRGSKNLRNKVKIEDSEDVNDSENLNQNENNNFDLGASNYPSSKNENSNDQNYRNLPFFQQRYRWAREEGYLQGMMRLGMHEALSQRPMSQRLKEVAIESFEKATIEIVTGLVVELTKLGISKVVEMWNQPSKEDLGQLEQAMELQQLLESSQKGIEEKQKLLAGNSSIITTAGQNVEQAQRIFNDQIKAFIYHQVELQKQQELEVFSKNLEQKNEQRIEEFKRQLGVLDNSFISDEQSGKLKEFIKQLEKDRAKKAHNYLTELETKSEKQIEQLTKQAVFKLLQTSPEAKFAQLFDDYMDMASDALKGQQEMMDGTLARNIYTMLNKKAAAAA